MNDVKIRKSLAGQSMIVAVVTISLSEIIRFRLNNTYWAAVIQLISMLAWIPATLGLVHLLRGKAPVAGLIGGGITLSGIIGATNLIAVRLYETVLLEQGSLPSIDTTAIFPVINLPGALFPLGLFLLGCWLLITKVIPVWAPILLILATLLFPFGRFWSIEIVIHITNALLILSVCWIGWTILRQPIEFWVGLARS